MESKLTEYKKIWDGHSGVCHKDLEIKNYRIAKKVQLKVYRVN